MKAWNVYPSNDMSGLNLVDVEVPTPGRGQIAVRLKAAAVNFRDVLVARNDYPFEIKPGVVPCSDGCWEVTAVGEGVTLWQPGDRVVNSFLPGWIDGPLQPWMRMQGLGANVDGTLTQVRLLDADMVVAVPPSISDIEAATLSTAGLTAWATLMAHEPKLQAGQTVLTLGTGAISLFIIQFAKAIGARVIVTSSSDAKLEKAKALGADVAINYVTTPDWDVAVRKATGGLGVNIVADPGGPPPSTIHKAFASVALGGRIAVMGVQTDPGDLIHPTAVFMAYCNLHGISVGSRRHVEELVATIDVNGIRPVIDSVYSFEQGAEALREFAKGKAFGKVIITG